MKFWITKLVLLLMLVGCKEQLTNRQIFERSLDKNLVVIEQYTQADSNHAEMKALRFYVLNSLYKIDSTFVRMNGQELDQFIKCHIDSLTLAFKERNVEHSQMSCKQMFDKYYKINIDMMSQILCSKFGVKDTAKAIECGKYILNSLYQIDSTFVKMKGDDLHNFINVHIDSLKNSCNN